MELHRLGGPVDDARFGLRWTLPCLAGTLVWVAEASRRSMVTSGGDPSLRRRVTKMVHGNCR